MLKNIYKILEKYYSNKCYEQNIKSKIHLEAFISIRVLYVARGRKISGRKLEILEFDIKNEKGISARKIEKQA